MHSVSPPCSNPGPPACCRAPRFWGIIFALVTLAIWLLQPESQALDADASRARALAAASASAAREGRGRAPSALWWEVRHAYGALWRVVQLRAVWGLGAVLLSYRLGVLVRKPSLHPLFHDQSSGLTSRHLDSSPNAPSLPTCPCFCMLRWWRAR